jgi:hypothetical protein
MQSAERSCHISNTYPAVSDPVTGRKRVNYEIHKTIPLQTQHMNQLWEEHNEKCFGDKNVTMIDRYLI